MTTDNTPNPATIWSQAFQTWMNGWAALAGQGAAPEAAPGDPIQLWRRSFDEWLAGWGSFLEEMLQSPQTVAAGGRTLDALLNVEKPLRERTAATMQYWLEIMNMPSRRDLIRVLTQLNDTNARLDELQEQIESLSDAVKALTAERETARA